MNLTLNIDPSEPVVEQGIFRFVDTVFDTARRDELYENVRGFSFERKLDAYTKILDLMLNVYLRIGDADQFYKSLEPYILFPDVPFSEILDDDTTPDVTTVDTQGPDAMLYAMMRDDCVWADPVIRLYTRMRCAGTFDDEFAVTYAEVLDALIHHVYPDSDETIGLIDYIGQYDGDHIMRVDDLGAVLRPPVFRIVCRDGAYRDMIVIGDVELRAFIEDGRLDRLLDVDDDVVVDFLHAYRDLSVGQLCEIVANHRLLGLPAFISLLTDDGRRDLAVFLDYLSEHVGYGFLFPGLVEYACYPGWFVYELKRVKG